jgi:hypothetical protein
MKTTIENIKSIVNDLNSNKLNKGSLKGFLGELIVKDKLEKDGYSVDHAGNQFVHDQEFDYQGSKLKIDVKSCFLIIPYYLGALRTAREKKISCTHFICVAFKPLILVPLKYYLIRTNEIDRFQPSNQRFN